jgi:hypothetical protein
MIVTLSVPANVVSKRLTVARIVAPISMNLGRNTGRPDRCSSVIVSIKFFSRSTSARTMRRAGVIGSTDSREA